MPPRHFILLLCFLVWIVHGEKYKENSAVPVFVNKVGPYSNPHETYHYYSLPVCTPDKIVHVPLSLSEVLHGDRRAEGLYTLSFKKNVAKTKLCSVKLDAERLKTLRSAIEENYYFEFFIDELPVRNFVGKLEEEGIFPHRHETYLYTHYLFRIDFNAEHIIAVSVDVRSESPVLLPEAASDFLVDYSYSVEWRQTEVKYENRQKPDASFFPKSMKIHWLSVVNSAMLVFLLISLVSLILVRVVRNDLIRYNIQSDEVEDELLENGWKVINTDVFRFPAYKNIFCAILGVGSQLLALVSILLLVSALNIINVHRHGYLTSIGIMIYALTSGIGGFVSASMYQKFNGVNWIMNINLTSILFAAPIFVVWCIENSVFWIYSSTQALPVTTVILLIAVWVLIGYPLNVLGGVVGKNFGKLNAPCRTRNIPREIPSLPMHHSCPVFCVVGGFLPFSAISVELYYIFATFWGHETYTLYWVLLIVFVILLSVTACISVALTYFQLSAEDYNWWWRSIFVGGSTGFFVLLYSIFYYFTRSEMSGILQTVQYFSVIAALCYGFFLMLGTVAFFSSKKFIYFIYSQIKTD